MTMADTSGAESIVLFLRDEFSRYAAQYPLLPKGPVLLLVWIFVLWIVYRCIRPIPLPKSLPGPKSHPLVGMLPYIIANWDDWVAETARLSQKYGRTWGGGLPNVPGLNGAFFFVTDEASVKHVLSDNFENYEKGTAFRRLFGDLLGVGIFASDGQVWKVHRQLTVKMFSRNLLRRTAEVTLSKLDEIADLFRSELRAGGSTTVSIDIQDIFFRLTFDTTSYVAFGCEMNSLAKGSQHPFATAFDEMQFLITERILDPFFDLKRLLQIGARERRISQLKQTLANEASAIINSRRRSAEDNSSLGPDLLSRFLDHAKNTSQPISDAELHSIIMNIMIAGRDTTACALAWGFYELSKKPTVVEKIVEEAEAICGRENPDYSYDTISKLRYTHAVVMETLRLHPSVPNEHKYAKNNDVLPDGTFVPAGAAVSWLPFAMGRSEELWGKDAHEFRPERFLDSKEPSPFKFTAFNAGPRTCLGKPLALMTMKMTLAYLLPKFDFNDNRHHSGEYKWTFVRSMKGGFNVDVVDKTGAAKTGGVEDPGV